MVFYARAGACLEIAEEAILPVRADQSDDEEGDDDDEADDGHDHDVWIEIRRELRAEKSDLGERKYDEERDAAAQDGLVARALRRATSNDRRGSMTR